MSKCSEYWKPNHEDSVVGPQLKLLSGLCPRAPLWIDARDLHTVAHTVKHHKALPALYSIIHKHKEPQPHCFCSHGWQLFTRPCSRPLLWPNVSHLQSTTGLSGDTHALVAFYFILAKEAAT